MVDYQGKQKEIIVDTIENRINRVEKMANSMRRRALKLGLGTGAVGAHFGPGLSIIELTATLYGAIMRINPQNPADPDRDKFILSKGHGSLGFYTALAEVGLITDDDLDSFELNDGPLPGQPQMDISRGIEISSGSLGHGLSIGIGISLVAREKERPFSTYVLMGDGECNEGSVWEAAMSAGFFKLGNLIAIVDKNGMQSDGFSTDIMDMGSLGDKWRSFGWHAVEVNGHNVGDLIDVFSGERPPDRPFVVIAHTVKGKGVSFMEGNIDWHHNRLTQAQYDLAMSELVTEYVKG